MLKILAAVFLCAVIFSASAFAQETKTDANASASPDTKKANQRAPVTTAPEPFDKADVKTMEGQCVKLETEAGNIDLEFYPETAPETVRNFLNLAATGFFDTTTFSRVVPGFVIQGGNISTSQKLTPEFSRRARRTIPDEPNPVKHERGIISMARPDEPNMASTHFFILLGEAGNLDGKFAAFGRVTNGMDVVEKINKMPVDGDKPANPVRINHAIVAACPARAENQ